jgi:hypothetical protein
VLTFTKGVLQPQLPQETKKCIITGSEKPHHALPRCCCGGSRSLANICARDRPASYLPSAHFHLAYGKPKVDIFDHPQPPVRVL